MASIVFNDPTFKSYQDCITYAQMNTKNIYCPEGVFSINSVLTLGKELTLFSDGLTNFNFGTNSSLVVQGSNITIKNIKFTSSDFATEELLVIKDGKDIIIENCTFDTLRKNPIKIVGVSSNITINNCKFVNSGNVRIKMFDTISNIKISKCVFSGNGMECINKYGDIVAKNVRILDNEFMSTDRMALELMNIDGLLIDRNKFFAAKQYYHLSIPGCSNVQVTNNYFTGSTENCIASIEIGSSIINENKNIIVKNNIFDKLLGSKIIETNTISGIMENIEIKNNTFINCNVKITAILFSKNVFFSAANGNRFLWNEVDCQCFIFSSAEASEFIDNYIYMRNAKAPMIALGNDSVFKYNRINIDANAAPLTGGVAVYLNNNVDVSYNTLNLNNKISFAFGDGNNAFSNIVMNNNRVMGPKDRITAVTNNTTFLLNEGNYSDKKTIYGNNLLTVKRIAYFLDYGVYINQGDPNTIDDFGGVGSLCLDITNGKLYVKQSLTNPKWVLK